MNLEDFINVEYPIYAHTGSSGGGEELLEEHIGRCQKYFELLNLEKEILNTLYRYLSKLELEPDSVAWKLAVESFHEIIFFHDLGKARPAFQKYIMKNAAIMQQNSEEGQETEHSLLSSIIYLDYYLSKIKEMNVVNKLEKRILKILIWENAFIISRHHGDLVAMDNYLDSFQSGAKRLIARLDNQSIYGFADLKYLNIENLGRDIGQYINMRKKTNREQDICFYFYSRFAYSILVACDYYATTEYGNNLEIKEFGKAEYKKYQSVYEQTELMKNIRTYEKNKYPDKELSSIKEMNSLRCEMFLDAENALAETNEDIIFLEAPTGAGKSNIAINLSLKLLQNKKKLLYIYPFNTLVEQNMNTLRKIFDSKEMQDQIAVVNSITPMKRKGNIENDTLDYFQKVLLDRQFLNYPFILSTHISLFSFLFSAKREDIFAFHQLIDSVVVLDEIQSYRNSIWAEIIIFLKVCAEVMGMKIIIMSATLPSLDYLAGSNCKVGHLLTDAQKYFQHPLFYNRVQISYELLMENITLEELKEQVIQHKGKKLLITFIKKKTAYLFYEMICQEELDETIVQLITGDDSMYDREQILGPIRDNKISDIILISTQVVEAGVDIDMDIGYKDISKLDSEEQFLGRINRSCRRNGLVYFFDLDDAYNIYVDDYRMNKELTLIHEDMRDVLKNKNYSNYYQSVMQLLKEQKNEKTNDKGLDSFFTEAVKTLDFPAVEERMRLIHKDNWHMSVVLCRSLKLDNGEVLNGVEIWKTYKSLLENKEMDYAEKRVKLSFVMSQLSYFIYQIKKNPDLFYNDIIGELICIFDGDDLFENGKLNKGKLEKGGILFLD